MSGPASRRLSRFEAEYPMVVHTPIAGVSTQREADLFATYPSICAMAPGRLLGLLFDAIPIPIGSLKLSHLIFPLPLSPLVVLLYLWQKIFGKTYVLTNRSVQVWKMALGKRSRLVTQVPLAEIDEVAVEVHPGQNFYHAGDVYLLAADGSTRARLEGIVRPRIFRENVLEARAARSQTDAALATINARHGG